MKDSFFPPGYKIPKDNVFLYVTGYKNSSQQGVFDEEASIATIKAMLYDEVVNSMENFGDNAILFTTYLSIENIKARLKHHKAQYLLIDLSLSFDIKSISGFSPMSGIDLIKDITKNIFSEDKLYLNDKLEKSVEEENYELAAILRDLKNKK